MAFILIITLTKTESSFYFPENIYCLNWFYHFLTNLYSTHICSVSQHHIAQNFPEKTADYTNFFEFCLQKEKHLSVLIFLIMIFCSINDQIIIMINIINQAVFIRNSSTIARTIF